MFTTWSLFSVWLVTNPKLYYCLGQGKKQLEEVWLWEADVSNLSDDIAYCNIDCEVIQVELSVGYICLLSLFL